ncbi:hybrid sensor histidine kinase/response regulator, partial [Pseudoalteromonas sp. SIMBA_148]
HNLVMISAASSMMFAASIVHCLLLSQFVNYHGIGFKLLCSVTAFCIVMHGCYSFFDASLRVRALVPDIQHLSEAGFLPFIL